MTRQDFKDKFQVTILNRGGQNILLVEGSKGGRRIREERPYDGRTNSPAEVANYLLNADLFSEINPTLTGTYILDWHTQTLTDEDGTPYTAPVLDDLKFTPATG